MSQQDMNTRHVCVCVRERELQLIRDNDSMCADGQHAIVFTVGVITIILTLSEQPWHRQSSFVMTFVRLDQRTSKACL